jgi:hypothetical protein
MQWSRTATSSQRSPIGRSSQCHHAVTHNLAKLTDKLFIAGTMVPGLASNCSTLELLNVRKRRPVVGVRRFASQSGKCGRSLAHAGDLNYSVVTEE